MVRKACDKCEFVIEVGDERAGQKVSCPKCGDVNVLPFAGSGTPGSGTAGSSPLGMVGGGGAAGAASGGASGAGRVDRASAAGYPPDSGPEKRVMLVRPAMLRARPMRFLALLLVVIAGAVGGVWLGIEGRTVWAGLCGAAAVAGLVAFGVWRVLTMAAGLEITNKRTILRTGLLSRASSEVVHDNIRNLQIRQTFWQRIWSVGEIGISSSGQDGVEIVMGGLAKPHEVRKVIDLYRPL
ncbi:MAG: PH domain-containing protein [Phycisphaerales bacterium]|jgi:hypothetical protein|nr:PH domain-containing protein [Phycisphaerales bacterium]